MHILEFTLGMLKPTEEDSDGITNPYISSRLLTNAVASTTQEEREREGFEPRWSLSCVVRSRPKVAGGNEIRVIYNSSLDCERNAGGDSSPFITRDATQRSRFSIENRFLVQDRIRADALSTRETMRIRFAI